MKRIIATLVIALTLLASCETDPQELNDITPQSNSSQALNKDIQSALGYTSINEMILDGWKRIENTTNLQIEDKKPLATSKAQSNITERLSFGQLNSLGFNEYRLRDRFKDIYGKHPDGIAINSENRFSGINPTITDQYSHFAYIHTATPTITILNENTEHTEIVYDHIFYNYSNQTDTHTIVRSYNRGTSTNWSVTESIDVSIGGKVGIPLLTEGSIEISVGVSTTQGGSQSNTVTDQIRSTITIPPYSKRRILMIEQSSYAKVKYDIPVYTSGYIGANFRRRVNGHYFWFNDINALIGSNGRDNQLGLITSNKVYKAEVFAYEAEAL